MGVARVLLVTAVLLNAVSVISAAEAKSVNVALRAKWKATPLLLEAAEFFADESKPAFWQFIDQTAPAAALQGDDCRARILSAGGMVSQDMTRMLNLSLSMRKYSPKVEMLRTLAEEVQPEASACCWVHLEGTNIMSVEELSLRLEDVKANAETGKQPSPTTQAEMFDHVYPSSHEGGPVAVLYGSPGVACFQAFHQALAAQRVVTYALRPVLRPNCAADDACAAFGAGDFALPLSGFGVKMDIKNMEYKAQDDQEIKAEKESIAAQDGAEGEEQDVRGFLFKRLSERHPTLQAELETFRDHLLSNANQETTLKVWDLKDLGLQAAQRIASSSDPLRLLQDVSQNFPSLASSLSRMQINGSVREEISYNQKQVPAGASQLYLNGAPLDVDNTDTFALLDRIRLDVRMADYLQSLHLPPATVKEMMSMKEPSRRIRVDYRDEAGTVRWLNNLEKDATYRKWDPDVRQLLKPRYSGRMAYVRKNLFNAVFVMDAASDSGLAVSDMLGHFLQNSVPVRLGALVVSRLELRRLGVSFSDDVEAPPSEFMAEEEEEMDMAMAELSDTTKASAEADNLSHKIAKMFYAIELEFGMSKAVEFLQACSESRPQSANMDPFFMMQMMQGGFGKMPQEKLDLKTAKEQWRKVYIRAHKDKTGNKLSKKEAIEELKLAMAAGSPADNATKQASHFAYSKGLTGIPLLLVNGEIYTEEDSYGQGIEGIVQPAIGKEVQYISKLVGMDKIDDDTDVEEYVMSVSGYPRFNELMLPHGRSQPQFKELSFTEGHFDPIHGAVSKFQYIHPEGSQDEVKPVSMWVVADPARALGRQLMHQAATRLTEPGCQARVAFLVNPEQSAEQATSADAPLITQLVHAATVLPTRRQKLARFLVRLLGPDSEGGLPTDADEDTQVKVAMEIAKEEGLQVEALHEALATASATFPPASLLGKWMGVEAGKTALVTNGRLLHCPNGSAAFKKEDVALAELLEARGRSGKVAELVARVEFTHLEDPDALSAEFLSSLVMVASLQVAQHQSQVAKEQGSGQSSEETLSSFLRGNHSSVAVNSEGDSVIDIQVLVDPLSAAAQKMAPLLLLLAERLDAHVRVYLNPRRDLSDLPLKNFYRYVLPSGDTHDLSPAAKFTRLPSNQVMTSAMDVPNAWLVEAVEAVYDLDNIKLEDLGDASTLYAVYELEALLVTGHCSELRARTPPRGVQLTLGSRAAPHATGTIVMSNLGYFQLQATAGLFTLSLKPGSSTKVYSIASARSLRETDNSLVAEAAEDDEPVETQVAVMDFGGAILRLQLRRRKEMEGVDVLELPDSEVGTELPGSVDKSLWKSMSSLFAGKAEDKPGAAPGGLGHPKKEAAINIFSVASGHLYERLLKIMIVSVLRHTDKSVKFWFIKNYLSPAFKESMPYMAKEYNFEYEMVTYKWPSWLNKQTEKQRIIWAYKILFLDVLFPLDLKKVIFVDADQIVRTDMYELMTMDLKGRALAYTPFCENNKDMDGYRFWKQGFWKDHLRGRPYHISALYVVDLAKLRRSASGDQLRVVYDNLSRDPNSLANLDQDLPNYAQHQVPIFSLPQEWLWCESWCGNSTKSKARTIDLCNNPETKESKLGMARRIVAEWPEYDEDIRKLTERTAAKIAAGKQPTEAIASPEKSSVLNEPEPAIDTKHKHDDVEL